MGKRLSERNRRVVLRLCLGGTATGLAFFLLGLFHVYVLHDADAGMWVYLGGGLFIASRIVYRIVRRGEGDGKS